MKQIPTRQQVDNKDKWAVNDIFVNDGAWENDYRLLQDYCNEEHFYRGKLGNSAKDLYNALKEYEEWEHRAERVYVYAFMKYYEDTSKPAYQEMSGKAQNIAMKLSEKNAFIEPEILSIDEAVLDEYFVGFPELEIYRHFINDMLAEKEHTLSEKEEELLAKVSMMASIPNEAFSKFNNADLKFDMIKDENGNAVELTNTKFAIFMQSNDRRVRKEAFYGLYRQYKAYINTLASLFYGNVKQAIFKSQARKYASTLDMYLSNSFIPQEVYTNLIETVSGHLDLMHKYVSIRKKALGVDELHFYDIYAPMVENYEWKINYEEAKEIVIKALKPLGDEYVSIIKSGFNNGWVDVYENIGKRNGAFSWGAYGTHPYVFLNYSGTLNDVFTLAHEMGHAMHTYYSNDNQPYIYAGYRIFVAEVASTCNEALLMNYLLENCNDDRQKKYLLNHYFEQFKGTLYRQTMFAQFEMITHNMAEKGEVLSAECLCRIYRELNEKYFGDEMVIDEEISYEWARIPHFYTPFYVYQYATGYSAAIAIASKILEGDSMVIEGYRRFLSGGSSMHPIELLKLCGIDMTTKAVVDDALKVFDKLLSDWEKM